MRNRKRFVTAALTLCSIASMIVATPIYAADTDTEIKELQLIIHDTLYVASDDQVGAQLIDGRVYVPLRLVGEAMQYQVQWLSQSRTACIMTEESSSFYEEDAFPAVAEDAPITIRMNGVVLEIDDTMGIPFLHESGRAMVPVRAVASALNYDVDWQDSVVLIQKKVQEVFSDDLGTNQTLVSNGNAADNRENSVANVTDRNQRTDEGRTNETNTASNTLSDDTLPWYYTLSVQGESIATVAQLESYLSDKEEDVRDLIEKRYPEYEFIGYPDGIAELYIEIGKKYNIRGDLAFAQAVKETGYFQFYGIVRAGQNNFCGLGATGVENTGEELLNGVDPSRASYIPGTHGITFATVADGVEAHIQHLYAYATTEDLPDGCEQIDPRFNYVKRGIAPMWTDLNGRWAVPGNGYGESIIADYWLKAIE